MTTPAQAKRPATNERVVAALDGVKAELARASNSGRRSRELARLARRC
jgi:hypothetical protein